MSQVIQITDWALHKFLEKVEEAVIAGYRTHKTPTSFAKSIGGRYTVTMVNPAEIVVVDVAIPDSVTPESDVVVEPVVKPTTRGRKKAGDNDDS